MRFLGSCAHLRIAYSQRMAIYKSGPPCKRGHADGRYEYGGCVTCARLRGKNRKPTDPIMNRKRAAAWAARNPARRMLSKAKWRAKRDGAPFSISVVDVVIPDKCPVFGIRLEQGALTVRDASPTLDKRIPALGYVPGNVTVISNRANRLKHDATLAELEAVVAWLKRDLI